MALNIKNSEVEDLASELSEITGESKTETIRRALQERKERLSAQGILSRSDRIDWVLKSVIWPAVPKASKGRSISKAEREDILGYGSNGV